MSKNNRKKSINKHGKKQQNQRTAVSKKIVPAQAASIKIEKQPDKKALPANQGDAFQVAMRACGKTIRNAAVVCGKNARTTAAVCGKTVYDTAVVCGKAVRNTATAWAKNIRDKMAALQITNEVELFLRRCYHRILRRLHRSRYRVDKILREQRACNFPESDYLPVQLMLLLWNILPMLGTSLREHFQSWKNQVSSRLTELANKTSQRQVDPPMFLGSAFVLAVVIMFSCTYTMGTTVSYDGELVGAVNSKATAESVLSDLEAVTTQTLGHQFSLDEDLVQYSNTLMMRQEMDDEATLEETLSAELGLVTPAYCLYVDGERIGATPYEGALEELLEQMQAAATTEDTISCSFKEEVEVREEYVPSSEIMNLGHLAELLYSTKTAEVTYEVKKGDVWSHIAQSHGLTNEALKALNPGYNINKLQIGEILTLSASVPYLTMTVVQQERYVDQVNFEIEYTDTPNMYLGDYKVTSPGQHGAADVLANVTYVNGEEVERTILSSVTLREPVTEQRLQGTKQRPTWHPTGTFRWPTTGRITSYFGGRKSPGGIGSTNHKGIDIAGRHGTPIYAADGGTVTYSGWMSGYGYLVQITHNNGYVTYYGHNSRLLVRSGQHVYKGQQIAAMGSTGNSTGNHCHFEVRLNGVAKNPLNYLR